MQFLFVRAFLFSFDYLFLGFLLLYILCPGINIQAKTLSVVNDFVSKCGEKFSYSLGDHVENEIEMHLNCSENPKVLKNDFVYNMDY